MYSLHVNAVTSVQIVATSVAAIVAVIVTVVTDVTVVIGEVDEAVDVDVGMVKATIVVLEAAIGSL